MRRSPFVLSTISAAVILVACGGDTQTDAPTIAPPVVAPATDLPSVAAPTQGGDVTAAPTEETVAEGPTATEVPPTLDPNLPPRPSAPAAVEEDFRSDSALHVANTGNPQLVEFFAFW